jgi:hypothetical protein
MNVDSSGGISMMVFIKEWSNKTATVMTGNGQVVWTFSSVAEARKACREWHSISTPESILYEDTTAEPENMANCVA